MCRNSVDSARCQIEYYILMNGRENGVGVRVRVRVRVRVLAV